MNGIEGFHVNHRMHLQGVAQAVAGIVALTAISTQANLTFDLTPESGTPQYAIDGFNAAASLWSAALRDDFTINIQIGFTSLGPTVLGQSAAAFVERSYSDVVLALGTLRSSAADYSSHAALQAGSSFSRLINHTSDNPNGADSEIPYVDTMDRVGLTTANGKVLGLVSPGGDFDATIRLGSDFNFDFDRTDGIGAGQYDFIGVAAHEIGHALGFSSGVDALDTSGGAYPGSAYSSNLFDLYRFSPLSLAEGAGIPDYTADARDKFFSVDGGLTEIAQLATGVNHGDGRQAGHWKDDLGNGLMDPSADPGELLLISDADLAAFDVLGFTLVPEPASGTLLTVGLLLAFRRRRAAQTGNGNPTGGPVPSCPSCPSCPLPPLNTALRQD
jgi:hypothetical protein